MTKVLNKEDKRISKNVILSEKAESALSQKINDCERIRAERVRTSNENPEIFLSDDDVKALRLGREFMKNQAKSEEESFHKVSPEYRKHLDYEQNKRASVKKKRSKLHGIFTMLFNRTKK